MKMVIMVTKIVVLIFGVYLFQGNLPLLKELPESHESISLPKRTGWVALGHHEALSAIYWFKLNNYFGKKFRGNRDYPWLKALCEVTTSLDKKAVHIYDFCASMLVWEAKDELGAKSILEAGLKNNPNSWKLWYTRGFFASYFDKDKNAAMEYFKKAATFPDAPPGVRSLSLKSLDSIDEVIDTLNIFIAESPDERSREVLKERLKRAYLTKAFNLLKKAISEYEKVNGKLIDLKELESKGKKLPKDPWGGEYYLENGELKTTSGKRPLDGY
jgi:tetratricopeptide (TPR) repeat protein